MFKKALAIAVIGAATATSVVAHASDWDDDAPRHAPPHAERYLNDRDPPHYVAPRYVAPYRYAAPAYRWAPSAYRWAPPPYRWVPAPRGWYPAYAYRGYDYRHPRYCPDR